MTDFAPSRRSGISVRRSTSRSRASASRASRRSSASARRDAGLTGPSSTASSISGRGRRAPTCRASRRPSTTRSARSSSASRRPPRRAARPAHRRDGARAPGRAARGGHDRGALPRAQARAGDRIQTQELYTLFGTAVAGEHGTRRLVGVAAQGMTACPCAQQLVAGARASASPTTASTTGRSSASSRPSPSRPTTSAASARCTSAARGLRRRHRRGRLLAIVEDSMSSEIYELMKRSDEGAVVEKAHRRPRFVEDCVREMMAGVVDAFPQLTRALRLRAPGEPGDDPPAQRRRRALRAARRAAARAGLGEARRHHTSMREWLDGRA